MAVQTETIALEKAAGTQIRRFDNHQRVQHASLMVSFTVLVLTGLPLKFSSWAISQWWTGLWGGVEVTRSAHHLAAYIIVAVCIYHLVYLGYNLFIRKKPFPVQMIPSRQDFTDLIQELMYFVGLKKEKPEFDRFNWREKFDYYAIFWGMPVMAGSGFILMYPVLATRFLPGWMVPAALYAHSDEAMLALCWIFFVHIFFNHFSPGIFPMNKSIFTGKVSRERYQKDHALEYERIVAAESKPEQP